jgi:hypothetical protein
MNISPQIMAKQASFLSMDRPDTVPFISLSLQSSYERFVGAGSPSYKKLLAFHGFRVPRRGVNNCFERFVGAGSPSYKK